MLGQLAKFGMSQLPGLLKGFTGGSSGGWQPNNVRLDMQAVPDVRPFIISLGKTAAQRQSPQVQQIIIDTFWDAKALSMNQT